PRYLYLSVTPTTEIYTLSLHDALPICDAGGVEGDPIGPLPARPGRARLAPGPAYSMMTASACAPSCFARSSCASPPAARRRRRTDRKSTRLNSSHVAISYAVFCLKKKK